jgi:purine nucleosidase
MSEFRRLLLLGFLALWWTEPAQAEAARRKVIIDEDVGAASDSNIQSIALLLQAPDVDLLGITVVVGDGPRDLAVAHVLRLVEATGRTEVPVVPGATAPLVNTRAEMLAWEKKFGRIAWKGAWNDPSSKPALPTEPPRTKPADETAAEFLVRQARLHPGEISLIANGPLTNVALACALDPAFAGNLRELMICAGTFDLATQMVIGSNFNIYFDPEAARIVFRAPWKKLTAASPESMVKVTITPAMEETVAAAQTKLTRHLLLSPNPGRKYIMWDEITTALWIDPSLATTTLDRYLDVDLDRGAGYGKVLVWEPGRQPGLGEPRAQIILGIDQPRFEKLFLRLIASAPR